MSIELGAPEGPLTPERAVQCLVDNYRNWAVSLKGGVPCDEWIDVLQDSFLTCWKCLQSGLRVRSIGALCGYYRTAVRRKLIDHWREKARARDGLEIRGREIRSQIPVLDGQEGA